MVQFFHGWRRKAGIVTLVMACAFWAGWVRSGMIGDRLAFQTHRDRVVFFGSNGGVLSYSTLTGSITPPIPLYVNWAAGPMVPQNVTLENDESWGVVHFKKAISTTAPRLVIESLEIPYWSIVIPLTFLSAYLLLWPQRKSSPN